uniref:Sema domain-containing protein n=1 Tax=Bubo bubo TaxID=30461 RepID=A0A8C0FCV1_BUBBB
MLLPACNRLSLLINITWTLSQVSSHSCVSAWWGGQLAKLGPGGEVWSKFGYGAIQPRGPAGGRESCQGAVRDGQVAITTTHCLYSATGNSPASCPDCVASPLGTSATVVATSYVSLFYLGSTINSSVAAQYSPQSVSIRRLKGTLDGFSDDFQWLTVLPQYRDNYTIHYVHSFTDGDHVYFLTVQPERPGSAAYHTRLARQPESRVPRENSAVCAFPLRLLNQAMEEGMEKCCGTGHQPLLRGCWDQPTLVPAASHKVDLFNGQLAGVLLTSIFVTALGDVTVAHMGTAEGRVFQV